jgi:hypothetical protein
MKHDLLDKSSIQFGVFPNDKAAWLGHPSTVSSPRTECRNCEELVEAIAVESLE